MSVSFGHPVIQARREVSIIGAADWVGSEVVSNPVQVSLIFILFLNRFLYTQFPSLFMCRYEFVFDFDKSVNILVHTFFFERHGF